MDMTENLSSLGYEKKAFGMTLYALVFLNNFYRKYLFKIPVDFAKRIYSLLKASQFLDYRLKHYTRSLDSGLIRMIVILLWPFRKFF